MSSLQAGQAAPGACAQAAPRLGAVPTSQTKLNARARAVKARVRAMHVAEASCMYVHAGAARRRDERRLPHPHPASRLLPCTPTGQLHLMLTAAEAICWMFNTTGRLQLGQSTCCISPSDQAPQAATLRWPRCGLGQACCRTGSAVVTNRRNAAGPSGGALCVAGRHQAAVIIK